MFRTCQDRSASHQSTGKSLRKSSVSASNRSSLPVPGPTEHWRSPTSAVSRQTSRRQTQTLKSVSRDHSTRQCWHHPTNSELDFSNSSRTLSLTATTSVGDGVALNAFAHSEFIGLVRGSSPRSRPSGTRSTGYRGHGGGVHSNTVVGMGLWLAQWVSLKNGGPLQIDSTDQGGTVVSLTLATDND